MKTPENKSANEVDVPRIVSRCDVCGEPEDKLWNFRGYVRCCSEYCYNKVAKNHAVESSANAKGEAQHPAK